MVESARRSPRQPVPGSPKMIRLPRRSARPTAGTGTMGAGGTGTQSSAMPSWSQILRLCAGAECHALCSHEHGRVDGAGGTAVSVEMDLEVAVRPAGVSGGADDADLLARADLLSD